MQKIRLRTKCQITWQTPSCVNGTPSITPLGLDFFIGVKAFFNFESTVSFSGFSVIMKLQSHSSVCRSRRKLERGSEMYKTKTNHTLFHWKYLRCILTIAWNCSGSVSLILFPTSMAPTMVRHQIFSTSENNIGIVLAPSGYKRIGIGTAIKLQAY